MPAGRTKQVVLDGEFLSLRAKILELAAGLDRIDRADGAPGADGRRERLEQAIGLLIAGQSERAARVQLLFSREYDEDWRDAFGV